MKVHRDEHGKFREITIGNTVPQFDTTPLITLFFSSSRWWESLETTCRWHLDSRIPPTLSQLNQVFHLWRQLGIPVDPDPQSVISPKASSHLLDDSSKLETFPASTSPMLRQSSRSYRPPQRFIKEMWTWTLTMKFFIVAIDWLYI